VDTDCNSFAPGGPAYPRGHRHRCNEEVGACGVPFEPERVHARPEGLESVLAEDADDAQIVQLEALGAADQPPWRSICDPTRDRVDPDARVRREDLDGLTRTES
jgi:hypothetical protein